MGVQAPRIPRQIVPCFPADADRKEKRPLTELQGVKMKERLAKIRNTNERQTLLRSLGFSIFSKANQSDQGPICRGGQGGWTPLLPLFDPLASSLWPTPEGVGLTPSNSLPTALHQTTPLCPIGQTHPASPFLSPTLSDSPRTDTVK